MRSHGFFYSGLSGSSGLFGLPIRSDADSHWASFEKNSEAILYVHTDSNNFSSLGFLASEAIDARDDDDGCVASCVDWYGNARPIFLGRRVFGLLGYELVEGEWTNRDMRELRRVSFSPSIEGSSVPDLGYPVYSFQITHTREKTKRLAVSG
jgi:hypothetical protein